MNEVGQLLEYQIYSFEGGTIYVTVSSNRQNASCDFDYKKSF